MSTLGMVGGIEVGDIFEKPGVAGDLREDWEDMDWISAREEEFLRDPEVLDADLSLREKSPMLAVMSRALVMRWWWRWYYGIFVLGDEVQDSTTKYLEYSES